MSENTLRRAFPAIVLASVVFAGCGAEGAESSIPDSAQRPIAELAARTTAAAAPAAGYAWVIFGADTVLAEVAATPDERAEGLMYREEVPDGTGMIFVFQDNQVRSFWMANTYVDLDIAYMDPSYTIVDIVAMEALVTDSYPSTAPAMFGLEVRQGWFAEKGIAIGAKADIVFGAVPSGG